MQGSLLPTEERAYARRSDPSTSHAAAASIPSPRITATQERVQLCLQRFGPLTQEQLVEVFRSAFPYVQVTDQRIRSACTELKKKHLAWVVSEPGTTSTGRSARKWAA